MSDKLRKKLNKILDMPSEIVLNTPKITLDSNESILIENYKGILEYSDVFVRVNTSDYTIAISGEKLVIDYMTKEEISVSGKLIRVEYD